MNLIVLIDKANFRISVNFVSKQKILKILSSLLIFFFILFALICTDVKYKILIDISGLVYHILSLEMENKHKNSFFFQNFANLTHTFQFKSIFLGLKLCFSKRYTLTGTSDIKRGYKTPLLLHLEAHKWCVLAKKRCQVQCQ